VNALAERPLLYAARPAIKLAGRERPELAAALTTLTVTETVEGLFALEATFGNWGSTQGEVGFLYFDRALFDFGVDIEVEMGAGEAEGPIFSGRVTALEGRFPSQRPPELLTLAEDRLQDLRMTRRTRSFEDAGIADVIAGIAADHGLDPRVDVDDVSYPALVQLNQSDLGFLRDLARAVGAELWLEGSALHVQARARRQGTEVPLVYGQTLREFAVSADLAHQRTSVSVSGWDVDGKTGIDEQATDTTVGSELASGLSGAALLREKLGERAERVVHHFPLTTREANAHAAAHFRRRARRFLHGRGVAEGDARIRVGARVTLSELGPMFNGAYYVSEARHTFDGRNGYRTLFTAERPGLGVG
jgi:phage protein D